MPPKRKAAISNKTEGPRSRAKRPRDSSSPLSSPLSLSAPPQSPPLSSQPRPVPYPPSHPPSQPRSQPPSPPSQPKDQARISHLDKHRVELLEGDVLYIPDFVSATESAGWYDDLDGLPTWHHPTLRVYNRDVVQSRAVAVYATSPRDMSYSGANIETHTPLPPLLDRIRGIVERRLGGDFSTVMLNRYESGDVHIGRHSDTRDNMIIASLSLGAERTFVLSPRLPPRALKEEMSSERKRELEGRRNVRFTMADRSLVVMQGELGGGRG